MLCINCNTVNDNENVFCVNCGGAVSLGVSSPNTLNTVNQAGFGIPAANQSTETAVIPVGQVYPSIPQFNPTPGYSAEHPIQSKSQKTIWFALGAIGLLGLAAGAYVLMNKTSVSETLPEHLGLFVQNNERNHVDEVRKEDVSNAIQAKNDLLKNESVPTLDASPNLILYSDGKDVPINDLRLVPLDSIKDDGSMKQLDFQAAPVEGKPEMKRIRVPDALANGKYAFVLLDGFLNDGKHKFWAFQVRNSSKSDNGDALKSSSMALKPTPPPQPSAPKAALPNTPSVPPPQGAGQATVRSGRVVMRNGPCLTCSDIGRVFGGQVVYVINYGGNFDTWGGRTGNWAYIQTPSGSKGWVFAPLLR